MRMHFKFPIKEHRWSLTAALAGAILSLPLLSYHFAFDQAIFAAIGDCLLHGGVAYRDAWELRPPGIFYTYYLSFALFGRTEWSVHLVELIGVACSCAALLKIGERRFASRRCGLLAAIIFPLLYVPYGHWSTAQCESFQLPFMLWGLALWPPKDAPNDPSAACLLSGLLMGAAVLMKTPAVTFCLVVLTERLALDRTRSGGRRFMPSLATLAGMATLPVLLALYYLSRGALGEFIDAVFVYGPAYARQWHSNSIAWHIHKIIEAFTGIPLEARVLLLVGVFKGMRSRPRETLAWVACLSAGLLGMALQRRYYGYHHIVLLPIFALGIGLAALRLPSNAHPDGKIEGSRGLILLRELTIILLIGTLLVRLSYDNVSRWQGLLHPRGVEALPDRDCRLGNFSRDRGQLLAGAIRELTQPDDRVFLWTNEPLAYFLSGRRMAGPFAHLVLVVPPWEGHERLSRLVEQFRGNKPALIVTGGDGALFRPESSEQLLQSYPEMRQFIRENYSEAGRVDRFKLWKLLP